MAIAKIRTDDASILPRGIGIGIVSILRNATSDDKMAICATRKAVDSTVELLDFDSLIINNPKSVIIMWHIL